MTDVDDSSGAQDDGWGGFDSDTAERLRRVSEKRRGPRAAPADPRFKPVTIRIPDETGGAVED